MIRTLYRRPDVDVVSPACDPIDALEGARPTWRMAVEDDPAWQETIAALGFDPTAAVVDVEVVDEPLIDETCRCTIVAPRALHEPDAWEQADDCPVHPLVEPPTRALQLVPALDPDDEVVVVECPDCGATGTDPCRPKSNPATGRPLTRQHRRRRELLEREAGRAVEWLLLLVVVLVVVGAVVGVVGSRLPDLLRVECSPAEQAAGCGWHP